MSRTPYARRCVNKSPWNRWVWTAVALLAACTDSTSSPHRSDRPSFAPLSPGTATLSPTADTWIKIDSTNYSTDTMLGVYTWPSNKIANATLMKFDLSSIPAGSVISAATLNVYVIGYDSTGDLTYTVPVQQIVNHNPDLSRATGTTYDGTNRWTANGCCFGNVPMAQADINAAVDGPQVDRTLGFKQWNVTSIVQGWFSNPSTNFGLLLNSDPSKAGDHWRYFASSRYSDATARPYLTVTYTPPVTQVLFQSNWTTALGTTPRALADSGSPTPWDILNTDASLLYGAQMMEVVGGISPPGYTTSLRIQQRFDTGVYAPGLRSWADVRKNPFIATANTDYYLRYYFMTNDTSGIFEDHGVEPWINAAQAWDLEYINKNEGASAWGLKFYLGANATDGHGGTYPWLRWYLRGQQPGPGPSQLLSYNTWYRLEYWVHFTTANHIQVHPRVYDASGTLLYQDADFVREDNGNGYLWCGSTQWSLADWYSRSTACNPGGDFQVNGQPASDQAASTLQSLVMGNNGSSGRQSGATTKPTRFWYYAAVKICGDTWCGP